MVRKQFSILCSFLQCCKICHEFTITSFLGTIDGIDPEVVAVANCVEDDTIISQAQIAWARAKGLVHTFELKRDGDWQSKPLGLSALMPAQIDLTHHDLEMRISDPFLYIKATKPQCIFPPEIVRQGDAVLTVNGLPFDNIGAFVKLTKESKDLVLEVTHLPDIKVDEE